MLPTRRCFIFIFIFIIFFFLEKLYEKRGPPQSTVGLLKAANNINHAGNVKNIHSAKRDRQRDISERAALIESYFFCLITNRIITNAENELIFQKKKKKKNNKNKGH